MMTRRNAIKTGALAGIALAALPRAFGQTKSASPSPTGAGADSAAELSSQILADGNLTQVRRMAQDLLKGGLNAGSGYD